MKNPQWEPVLNELTALFALASIKLFGPQKFKLLYKEGLTPSEAVRDPARLPIGGKLGTRFREEIHSLTEQDMELHRSRAAKQISRSEELGSTILTYSHHAYPENMFVSNYPVPVLYARGNLAHGTNRLAVACVGSRKIRQPYASLLTSFAETASKSGFVIVSGFAVGADEIGHRVALHERSPTIGVMPSGLDRPFPPENKPLWTELLASDSGLMVSESPFGTGASALTLRRRNKLIVALSLAVLVAQSAKNGGAMNAYRFGKEQKKPVGTFTADGKEDSDGNGRISVDLPQGGEVFRNSDATPNVYRAWLRQLSSSI